VDTYNLLVKLFVEEYHSRYAQTIKHNQSQWAAYPLEKRYASFEDVYYLYLLSLADPIQQYELLKFSVIYQKK
ncbi:MAG: hypothetical protein ACP5I1_15655, partial [Candidatus Hinthialibacter sp.]